MKMDTHKTITFCNNVELRHFIAEQIGDVAEISSKTLN